MGFSNPKDSDDYYPFYHHPDFDGATALDALRQLIETIYKWRDGLSASVTSLDGIPDQYVDDVYVDRAHRFVYQDVACCNSAIGSIAPFIEGLFLHECARLRVRFSDNKQINDHHRWNLEPDDFWTPSIVSDRRTKTKRDLSLIHI